MNKETVDVNKTRELYSLLENLTHSGKTELNPNQLKATLDICNLGSSYVLHTYDKLNTILSEKHSEVRYSAVQLYDKLFLNYDQFRNAVAKDLDVFFKLTMGIRNKEGLPPPTKAAKKLVRLAISTFNSWFQKFGKELPCVRVAYNYLQNTEKVDLTVMEIIDPKERARKEEREKRLLKIMKEKLSIFNKEMNDIQNELDNTLISLETCFSLILPRPEDFAEDEKVVHPCDDSRSDMRLFGVLKSNQELGLEFNPESKIEINEDEDNSIIIQNAKDLHSLIVNKFLPKTKAWIQLITKAEGGVDLLKKALSQKQILELAIAKYNRLDIKQKAKKKRKPDKNEDDEVSTDSELEEVPVPQTSLQRSKEEFSLLAEKPARSIKSNKVEGSHYDDLCRPSTSSVCDTATDRKKELLKIAPKLPFDIDLYHWEDKNLKAPTMLPVSCEGHRFWSAAAESLSEVELEVPGGAATLRSRVIEFTGSFVPVTRACSAPLPSGKLCPRHDRIKCPFHGTIVPRDEVGNIIDKKDEAIVEKSKLKTDIPDWQDPKLLAEIKEATGVDLKMPEKGKRKKKKKFPGLTDIKEVSNTPVNRISKKVFKRSSLKRIAQTLDRLDHKRFRDKFGDQFNYVHDTC